MTLALHIGASGMGKTYALAKLCERHADAGWRVLVVDVKREWAVQSKRGALVSGPEGARKVFAARDKIAVWQAPDEWGEQPDATAACTFALEEGKAKGGILVAIPECHLHFPNGPRPAKPAVEVLTGYRHRGLAVMLDTQRLVSASTMLRNNPDVVRVFGVVGKTDLQELTEWGGPALATAATECARKRRLGERGWFVAFDPANPAGPGEPYTIARFV